MAAASNAEGSMPWGGGGCGDGGVHHSRSGFGSSNAWPEMLWHMDVTPGMPWQIHQEAGLGSPSLEYVLEQAQAKEYQGLMDWLGIHTVDGLLTWSPAHVISLAGNIVSTMESVQKVAIAERLKQMGCVHAAAARDEQLQALPENEEEENSWEDDLAISLREGSLAFSEAVEQKKVALQALQELYKVPLQRATRECLEEDVKPVLNNKELDSVELAARVAFALRGALTNTKEKDNKKRVRDVLKKWQDLVTWELVEKAADRTGRAAYKDELRRALGGVLDEQMWSRFGHSYQKLLKEAGRKYHFISASGQVKSNRKTPRPARKPRPDATNSSEEDDENTAAGAPSASEEPERE